MHCSRCHLPIDSEDNYCRKCGSAVDVIDVPAVRSESKPARRWRSGSPTVARGVALVAAGAVLRVLVEQAVRVVAARALSDNSHARRALPFAGRSLLRGAEEIEVFWYRRIRR
jgi:hypothetical protein